MGLKYIGHGASADNIPARDLTDAEVEACGGIDLLMATGLYEVVDKETRGTKVKRHDDNEDGA